MSRLNVATLFSAPEVQALKAMVKQLTKHEGEDIIGVIMKTSGHVFLDDEGVVALARKLEER